MRIYPGNFLNAAWGVLVVAMPRRANNWQWGVSETSYDIFYVLERRSPLIHVIYCFTRAHVTLAFQSSPENCEKPTIRLIPTYIRVT